MKKRLVSVAVASFAAMALFGTASSVTVAGRGNDWELYHKVGDVSTLVQGTVAGPVGEIHSVPPTGNDWEK